jgi:putative SOS response-associated peptidase YedK
VCGRYRLSRRKQFVEEYFDTVSGEEEWTPRYNIAPTQPIPVIRQNPKEPVRELTLIRWGLIPSWAKDPSVAAQMINARSETAGTKARVPRCDEISQVPDSCGRILRVGADGKSQAAVLF